MGFSVMSSLTPSLMMNMRDAERRHNDFPPSITLASNIFLHHFIGDIPGFFF